MKMMPIGMELIPETGNGNVTKHRIRQIEAFMESGEAAAEVTDFAPMKASHLATALAAAAKRHGYRVQAVQRGERVFLIRKQ